MKLVGTDLKGRIRDSTDMTEPILISRWVGGGFKVGIEIHKVNSSFSPFVFFEGEKKKKKLKTEASISRNFARDKSTTE